jgi:hypothetical protein
MLGNACIAEIEPASTDWLATEEYQQYFEQQQRRPA